MVVTGVVRGAELDRVSGEGADYEAAKAQMMSRVPEGLALGVTVPAHRLINRNGQHHPPIDADRSYCL